MPSLRSLSRVLQDSSNNTTTASDLPPSASTINDDNENDTLAVFSAIFSNCLLFLLIFGLSATVNVKNLKKQLTNKWAIATGVAMQFIIMPFLGFCAVLLFQNSDDGDNRSGFTTPMGITLLVVTASPGGSYSNWWCAVFNAELALSVAMTSVSSLLSTGLLPANLFFYSWLTYGVLRPPPGEDGNIDLISVLDFGAIFVSLGVVLSAILLGLMVGYRYDNPTFHQYANTVGTVSGLLLILFSVFLGGGAGGAEVNVFSMPWSFYLGVALPCAIGMALANLVSRCFRLSPPEMVAISIECCYQNTAIATSVAITMFSDLNERAEAVSVPLFYGFVEAFIIASYCVVAWKLGWTKAPAEEKICVIITHTYEVPIMDETVAAVDDPAVDADHNVTSSTTTRADNQDGSSSTTATPATPTVAEGSIKWRPKWFDALFEPRVPHSGSTNPNDRNSKHDSNSNNAGGEKNDPDKESKQADMSDSSRFRANSADVTVMTSTTTPPGTPALPLTGEDVSLSVPGDEDHLEAPTFRERLTSHEMKTVEEE